MNEEKSKLEQKVFEGIYGIPEIKKDEKKEFLGEFKERVIRYLTYDQVMEKGVYTEIGEAIKDPEAKKLVIDRRVDLSHAQDYINLARKHNLAFKRIDSPDLKGDIALIVVSDHAVDVRKRKIMDREERLQKLGISDNIIKNVGAKLCNKCWAELKEKAPGELVNYRKISWIERLLGAKCNNCN